MKTPNGDTRGTKLLPEERQMRRSFGWGAGDGGLALGRNCKSLCGPRNRNFAALLAFPSFPKPPGEPLCPWPAAPRPF